MIRYSLLFVFSFGLTVYAWRDWYKSLCGLILLMAVLEHPDMPKNLLGFQGVNVWNIVCASILLSWAVHRGEEGLSWDMPGHISILLLLYLSVVLAGFFRMISDARFLAANPLATSISEYLVNTVKWVIPGLLLFDGCRNRSRFTLALFSLLALYFLLGLQVIRWIPPGEAVRGAELTARSLKILMKEVGFHRVNLSMMLAGASWAVLATVPLVDLKGRRFLIITAFVALVYAQALTAGRTGYATWAIVGLSLALIRWRKFLLLVPLVILVVIWAVPGAEERMAQGFSKSSRDQRRPVTNFESYNPDKPDLYTITAGRNIAWHFVVKKIGESPLVGFGRQAMQRTGISDMLMKKYAEEFPHPHNAYLEMLLDNGWVGFLLVVPFYFVILRHAVSLFRDSGDPVFVSVGGVTCALVIALLVGSVGSQTFYPREGSVPMWCAIGLMLRVYVERSRGFSWPEKAPEEQEEGEFWTRESATS